MYYEAFPIQSKKPTRTESVFNYLSLQKPEIQVSSRISDHDLNDSLTTISQSNNIIPELEETTSNCVCEESDSVDEEYRECLHLSGDWGVHVSDECKWLDADRPFVKLHQFEELELTDNELDGELTDRIVACFISYFDRSPEVHHYAFCKCNLSNLTILTDISILKYYHYLQYLDLSHNKLKNLEPLGELPFLMYLNVSYNNLDQLLQFKAPFNLTYADFSHNNIAFIGEISQFWSLKTLNISYNMIFNIVGLKNFRYLRILNLSNNNISELKNLDNMRLRELYLQNNNIYKFEENVDLGLNTLSHLRVINLSNNCLTTLRLLKGVENLEHVDISSNNISNILDLVHLNGLRYLVNLNLSGNPISKMKHYYKVCCANVKNLYILDNEYISVKKHIDSKKPTNLELLNAMRRVNMVLLENLNDPEVTPYVLPYDVASKPIIILVSLPGSNVKILVKKVAERYKRHVRRIVGYTTKPKSTLEVDDEDYHFVDKDTFQEMLRNGEFVSFGEFNGHMYGTAKEDFIHREEIILLLHMNLEAALMLKIRGYSPKLLLCLPSSPEIHLEFLRSKYFYYYDEKQDLVYIQYNPTSVNESKSWFTRFKYQNTLDDIRKVLYALVDYVLEKLNEKRSELSIEEELANDSGTFNIEQCLVKSITDSSEKITFEDLQGKEETNSEQYLRVDFAQNETKYIYCDDYEFDEIEFNENDSYNAPTASISKDVIDHNVILSVLSHSHLPRQSKTVEEDYKWHSICKQMEAKARLFFKGILEERAKLLDYHFELPGLFQGILFTDDVKECTSNFWSFLKKTLQPQESTAELISFKDDESHKRIITARLQYMFQDMENDLSTSRKQKASMLKESGVFMPQDHSEKCLIRQNFK